jgi:hypothetical protein
VDDGILVAYCTGYSPIRKEFDMNMEAFSCAISVGGTYTLIQDRIALPRSMISANGECNTEVDGLLDSILP